jgi:hypothetical protein
MEATLKLQGRKVDNKTPKKEDSYEENTETWQVQLTVITY